MSKNRVLVKPAISLSLWDRVISKKFKKNETQNRKSWIKI